MNKNKIKIFLEIVYNCPFLLLLCLTTLLFFVFTDGTGERNSDKNMAVIRPDPIGELARKYEELVENHGEIAVSSVVPDEENGEKEEIVEQNNDTAFSKTEAEISQTGKEMLENAGGRKGESANTDNIKERKNDLKKPGNALGKREERERATKFVEYTPIAIDSRYYSDAGKVALTTTYDYVLENDSYFNDAVFMGDSRTLGISDYAGFEEADFFCDNGMTIYKLLEDKGVTYQKTGEKEDLKEILQEKHYGKIYIMLGMNELGYGDTSMYLKQYLKVLRQIREWQPDAVIFIMANLHVSREKNQMETEFNNININDKNVASARLADGRDVFYLDCNPLFTDDEGYLQAELTFDGVHLYAQHYDKWREFLLAHGVEREGVER